MASGKKASEGIALLSMYGDDEDDEMEHDLPEEEEQQQQIPDNISPSSNDAVSNNESTLLVQNEVPTENSNYGNSSSASVTPQQQVVSTDSIYVQTQKSRLTIVDYGHEEGALSPEPEEGEIKATTGRVMYGEMLQTTSLVHITEGEFRDKRSPSVARIPTPSTQATTPQTSEPIDQIESNAVSYGVNESEYMETEDVVMVSNEEEKDVDPLDKFLPPPPTAKCSEELQERISRFLTLKRTAGRSFNSEVRNRKEYRNPDFLLHAVTYQDIDQIGSCFSKDVFDPHGYDKSDFYDEIEADTRREMERREQERKKSQKLDFTSGGVQPGNVVPTPKVSLPPSGLSAAGVSNVTPATSDVTARDGRQNKKSKWDKVDVDQRSSRTTGGQENASTVGAHAALLSAAKAGSGYSAFAQQRRKEAEDRRSSDRKVERRS